MKSYPIKGNNTRPGLYECAKCKRQFTVTTATPLHSTKLSLWTWLKAMYLIVNSSKGISSVFLGRLVGTSQKTAWKIGHAIRELTGPQSYGHPVLQGVVELDDKYLGGKPRYQQGVVHKRGKGTEKQQVLIAIERAGQVRATCIESDSIASIKPWIEQTVHHSTNLMSDMHHSFLNIGKQFDSHQWVNHGRRQYASGDVHSNTAESFFSIVERTRKGVFHYMSRKHLARYMNEIGFRWDHRIPKKKKTKSGKIKIYWRPMPVMIMLNSLLKNARGRQIRRSKNGGLVYPKTIHATASTMIT